VVYSATKHIDGQGRCLGGIILSSEAFIAEHIHNFMRQTGPSMSPFNAWVLLKGLETLAVRVRAQTETAAKVADSTRQPSEDLAADLSRPRRSPAGGAGEEADARRLDADRLRGQGRQGRRVPVLNALQISRISNNLGDAKSLVTHPATTTHQRLTPEARAELGISEASFASRPGSSMQDDLIEDFAQALEKV
jgi:O-succinylhomoserine sulfhydrylase